jgi:hypothetical protein
LVQTREDCTQEVLSQRCPSFGDFGHEVDAETVSVEVVAVDGVLGVEEEGFVNDGVVDNFCDCLNLDVFAPEKLEDFFLAPVIPKHLLLNETNHLSGNVEFMLEVGAKGG